MNSGWTSRERRTVWAWSLCDFADTIFTLQEEKRVICLGRGRRARWRRMR